MNQSALPLADRPSVRHVPPLSPAQTEAAGEEEKRAVDPESEFPLNLTPGLE